MAFLECNTITIQEDNRGVLTITLNREDVRNAINPQMINELRETMHNIHARENIRVIVIQGQGKHFCAGADLNWMEKSREFSLEENRVDAENIASLFECFDHMNKPIIAVVKGNTLGGGLGILACCDIVIADEKSQFCFSEARLGLIPATIAPYVIECIGMKAARELFLTADAFNAEKARAIGLVSQISTSSTLPTQLEHYVHAFLNNAPQALCDIKTLLRKLPWCETQSSRRSLTASMIAQSRVSAEGQEGIRAFFEKRPPHWSQPS